MIQIVLSYLIIYGTLILFSLSSNIISKIIWFPLMILIIIFIELTSKKRKLFGDEELGDLNKESKVNLENISMIIGSILLVFSFVIPFILNEKSALLLGTTATPFVSAAAFLLLVSANIMQRKELTLQRKELTATRVVFTEQSKTMSRQRFENTFFNMMNLHHSILANLKLDTTVKSLYDFRRPINADGRELISDLYDEFKYLARKEYREFKFNKYFSSEEITETFYDFYPKYEKERLFEELNTLAYFMDEKEYALLAQQIYEGKNAFDNHSSLQRIVEEHPRIQSQINNVDISLKFELLKLPEVYYSSIYHPNLDDEFIIVDSNEWEEVKIRSYETFYKKLEFIFGHYYRNLYRIIKYINETELIDDLSKKEFRGILRAQLSSNELMMLFYNVMYSEKGEKFKKQLQDKNFFDDHLVIEDFVWNDDISQLRKIK